MLLLGLRERWNFAGFQKSAINPSQRLFQMQHVRMPFGLNLVHRTDHIFESLQTASFLKQLRSPGPVSVIFKDKVRERPPVQVIKIEMAAHAWAAAIFDDGTQRNHAPVLNVL